VALGACLIEKYLLFAVISRPRTLWSQTNWPRCRVAYEMSNRHWEVGINERVWRKRIPPRWHRERQEGTTVCQGIRYIAVLAATPTSALAFSAVLIALLGMKSMSSFRTETS
jgi:hypothetical protein